jgi:hypothetical protein
LVVIKVLRALGDDDMLRREWEVLKLLGASDAQGAPHFTTRLPQLVSHGVLRDGSGQERLATILRWHGGFQHTFLDVVRAYPHGTDARTATWMWRRLLEVIGWAHANGYVHGAVLPQHAIVHPRNHGVLLVGWSCATRVGGDLPATSACDAAFYPPHATAGAPTSRATDLAMAARCIVLALGGNPATGALPSTVPGPIVDVLTTPPGENAWSLADRVADAARIAFGPPSYHPFSMPGWT